MQQIFTFIFLILFSQKLLAQEKIYQLNEVIIYSQKDFKKDFKKIAQQLKKNYSQQSFKYAYSNFTKLNTKDILIDCDYNLEIQKKNRYPIVKKLDSLDRTPKNHSDFFSKLIGNEKDYFKINLKYELDFENFGFLAETDNYKYNFTSSQDTIKVTFESIENEGKIKGQFTYNKKNHHLISIFSKQINSYKYGYKQTNLKGLRSKLNSITEMYWTYSDYENELNFKTLDDGKIILKNIKYYSKETDLNMKRFDKKEVLINEENFSAFESRYSLELIN
ncbi:MAG: hypothetical protein K2Q03_03825 [Sphingobacteriaceae bacterium]|nr:hypothetical protein [Sphingobacteriaceae bacterium]